MAERLFALIGLWFVLTLWIVPKLPESFLQHWAGQQPTIPTPAIPSPTPAPTPASEPETTEVNYSLPSCEQIQKVIQQTGGDLPDECRTQ